MAVTVVRNVSGKSPVSGVSNQADSSSSQLTQALSNAARTTVAGVAATGDATVSAIRISRSSTSSDRIKDPKEARKVADEVADRVKHHGEGLEAHSELSPVSAREHFAG